MNKPTHTNKQYKTFELVRIAYLNLENPSTKKIVYCKLCEAYHLLDKS